VDQAQSPGRPEPQLKIGRLGIVLAAALAAAGAAAQVPATAASQRFDGTELTIGGHAEIDVANDEATANLFAEQQDADQAHAQSVVNQRVGEGIAALRRADPQARLETGAYSTYPVYAPGAAQRIVAWRVRQVVSLRTANLADLPRTIAAAQAGLALGELQFGLSRAARERVEAELVQRAIADANARIGAAAQALGVPPARVRLEALDFEGQALPRMPMMMRAAQVAGTREAVAEPTFEAGTSTQQAAVTARARLLPPP
jgi:predicted secreted protein